MLQIAPSGYQKQSARQRDPSRHCRRTLRDAVLLPQIARVCQANLRVYGADEVWRQLQRKGTPVARCTVERLMRRLGLHGMRRGKSVRTTVPDTATACPQDHVNRQFRAERPNPLWVSDFTYVSTWQGFVYVAFVSTSLPAASSAGVSRAPCAPTSCSMRSSKRCTPTVPSATAA